MTKQDSKIDAILFSHEILDALQAQADKTHAISYEPVADIEEQIKRANRIIAHHRRMID